MNKKNVLLGDYPSVLEVETKDHRVVIVGDTHISGGKYPEDGKFMATENFFYDSEFASFLEHLMPAEEKKKEKPWILVINGDFLDVVRLTAYPQKSQYKEWLRILDDVGIKKKIDELEVSDDERDVGLKTHEYKSVWKLDYIAQAHSQFFQALARFIEKNNRLIIIKGNHDVEFYWEKFRLKFKHILLSYIDFTPVHLSPKDVAERIEFCDKACIVDKKIYIEHGHQYERITSVAAPTLLKGTEPELMLPFGSFLNRYFVNKVEQLEPYMNNIKPPTSYIDATFKRHPIRSIKLILKYIPLTGKILKKKYPVESLRIARKIGKYLMIPLSLLCLLLLPSLIPSFRQWLASLPLIGKILADIKVGSFISLATILMPFILPVVLREKDYVTSAVRKIMKEHPGLSHIILGHWHSPDYRKYRSVGYFNSGTWIPQIILREKLKPALQFCVIRIDRNKQGSYCEPQILKWNDCARRLEQFKLFEFSSPEKRKKAIKEFDSV